MARKPRPIITIDVETDPFERGTRPMPFLWGFYDGERYRSFSETADMVRYLQTLPPTICYAHNGGKFDYNYLFAYMEPWVEVLMISGRMAKFSIGNVEFRDSWSILPMPLREYKKDKIDMTKLRRENRAKHMAEIIRYNTGDCKYLFELVAGFTAKYGTSLTLAGAAMKFWTEHFEQERVESDGVFYHSLERYYSGGRVQCFTKGEVKSRFHVVDINSAYPYAMKHHHPISTKWTDCVPKEGDPIVGDSFYDVSCVSAGALGWRDERFFKVDADGVEHAVEKDSDAGDADEENPGRGPLLFPDDDRVRVYHTTGWELQAAILAKALTHLRIIRRVDFGKSITFKPYVEHFYAQKKAAKKGTMDYIFAKLMQNSLYGKYGANPANYCSAAVVPVDDIIACEADPSVKIGRNYGPWKWSGMVGHYALLEGRDPTTGKPNPVRSQYYNVATAASITGFVRAYLFSHIAAIRKRGGIVHYCDTDSIVYELPGEPCTYDGTKWNVSDPKAHPFTFTKELGDWTYEGRFRYGAIAGKKLYAFQLEHPEWDDREEIHVHWKKACKGMRLTPEQICRVAQGEEIVWESDAPDFSYHRRIKKGETVPAPRFLARKARKT